ncbi:MAG: hypothetical protein RIB67_05810 [Miltoncostaeaceae bacterium]
MERDFDEVGHRVRAPRTLGRWLAAYAAATSSHAYRRPDGIGVVPLALLGP